MSDDSSSDDREQGTRVSPRSPREALQPEPAPGPPAASRRARNPLVVVLSGIFTTLLLGVIFLGAVLYVGKVQFESAGPLAHPHTVHIPQGQSTLAIAQQLEREGVVDHSWMFVAGVLANRARGQLQAGEYVFPERASMRDVLDRMVSGAVVVHQITIPEGFTSEQIVERLRAEPILTGEIAEIPPEGSLLPATYRYSRNTTRQSLIERMARAQERVLSELWERRIDDLPLQSPDELVILASIVEKETGRADERPRVAGVFINRLRQGMRLQSDPTILYGLYGGSAFMQPRTITRSELDAPNPFSTYQINGLPPTPIGNPGRAAMEAVINPSRTRDLYFVADGTGGHAFAETLDQHNRNVSRWRQIERERRDAREADAAASDGGSSTN